MAVGSSPTSGFFSLRLYSFTLEKPRKVTGDGFKDAFGGQKFTWHVARPTAGKSSSGSTTGTGTSTYTYPGD